METIVLVSTRSVNQRWRQSVESAVAVRGNLYYIAPGTTAISVGGRTVTPSDNHDGLTPFSPLATINEFESKVVTGAGDVGVLIKPGTYTLGANIATSKSDLTLIGAPQYSKRSMFINGIAGGHALALRGRHTQLINLEVGGADALFAAVAASGRYFRAIGVHFTSVDIDVAEALYGLNLFPYASEDGGFAEIIDCLFNWVTRGIQFGLPQGQSGYNVVSEPYIRNSVFSVCSVRSVGQEADSAVSGMLMDGNKFMSIGSAAFITLDQAGNGAEAINHITNNDFADNAIDNVNVALTNTTTRFKFTGNRDKAGFITTI